MKEPREVWRQVPVFTMYSISSTGRFRSRYMGKDPRGGLKKIGLNKRGYPQVQMKQDGMIKTVRIHRLVAEAFIPNPRNLPQVNHIDGNKQNNHVSNLEWTDNLSNMRHAIANGLRPICPTGKDGWANIPIRCIDTGEEFPSLQMASDKYGCTKQALGRSARKNAKAAGMRWEYVNGIRPMDKRPHWKPNPKRGGDAPQAVAVQCIETGEIFTSVTEAARSVNRPPSNISRVCSGGRKSAGGYSWRYINEPKGI